MKRRSFLAGVSALSLAAGLARADDGTGFFLQAGVGAVAVPPPVANTPLAIFVVPGFANASSPYSMVPAVKGGAGAKIFSLNGGSLPTGLSFSTATGAVVGTPSGTGTKSGLSITCTDATGTVTSNTFSLVVGAAAVALVASGDTTGATDIAAINALLAAGTSVSLTGHYYANDIIQQPSNTAIYANTGEWTLVAGANCRMWCNANQTSITRTDNALTVSGDGNFYFNGQPSLQVRQTNQRTNHGFDAISANNVKISGIQISANASCMMVLGSTNISIDNLIFAQDNTTINQDGLDIGPGSSNVKVSGARGTVYDDAFSFFAKAAQSSSSMIFGTPWAAGANVSNVIVSDVYVLCGLQNMFRLQAGDTFQMLGVYGYDINNSDKSGDRWLIQVGAASFILVQPAANDYQNIYMEKVSGFAVWASLDTHFQGLTIYNIDQNVALTQGIGVLAGSAVTGISNILVDGATQSYTGATTMKVIAGNPAGCSMNNLTIRNIFLTTLTNVLNSVTAITGLVLKNIAVTTETGGGPMMISTAASSGTMDNVSVAKGQIPVSSSGVTILNGVDPNIGTIVINSPLTATVIENRDCIVDLYANQALVFTLQAGNDTALCTLSDRSIGEKDGAGALISPTGGRLRLTGRDFENPSDADLNNIYIFNVRATDATAATFDFTITVTVTDDNAETFAYHPKTLAYQAVRATPLTPVRLATYDRLIKGLAGDVNLPLMDRIYMFADQASSADSLFNLLNPTGTKATLTVGSTFTANLGHKLNGTSQAINAGTTYGAEGKYTQDSASIGVVCNLQGAGSGTKPHMSTDVSAFTQLNASDNSTQTFRVNGSGTSSGASTTTRLGQREAVRTSSTVTKFYMNGVRLTTDSVTTSAAISAGNVTIGQSTATFSPDRFAAAWTGAGGTDQQIGQIVKRVTRSLLDFGAAA